MMHEKIVIYDFGSQYTQLIARRIRELSVYSEIVTPRTPVAKIKDNLIAIILSGGPQSVYDKGAMKVPKEIFSLGKPILGICYGYQLLGFLLGGKILAAKRREYGLTQLRLKEKSKLFDTLPQNFSVWMSHGDEMVKLPPGFITLASTEETPFTAIADLKRQIYGLQFHPEVSHTQFGTTILKNFLYKIAKAEGDWKLGDFIKEKSREIKESVEENKVVLALSGGVDSSVLAHLLYKTIDDQLYPIFVDTGLLKLGEKERIKRLFADFKRLKIVNAQERFFKSLVKIEDPEEKRKRIGKVFAQIFMETSKRLDKKIKFWVQGTLYPDWIESGRGIGPAAVIKTHHNVGGLPKELPLELLEPFRELFKDEVRKIGNLMGLKDEILERHPFPGPGFGVRIIGDITKEKVSLLQLADRIVEEETKKAGLYKKLWQIFPIFLPIRTVGVMGDLRTYENVIALRAVESLDGMTADWARLPYEFLEKITSRIVGKIKGINRVVYDTTSKPPATIEWE